MPGRHVMPTLYLVAGLGVALLVGFSPELIGEFGFLDEVDLNENEGGLMNGFLLMMLVLVAPWLGLVIGVATLVAYLGFQLAQRAARPDSDS